MSQVTSSLGDKYSRYFAPDGWKRDRLRTNGKAQGLGITMKAGSSGVLVETVAELQRRNGARLNGLVLDLRGNPGGLTAEAHSLLNMFIPAGDLFYFSRHKQVVKRHTADPAQTPFADLRLTVLVDKKSASSSEIVAGSLKQRGRATLVGEKTFGKGIGQSNFNLPDGSGFRLTDFHIGLPVEGQSKMVLYHQKGIQPHVSVPPADAMERALTTF